MPQPETSAAERRRAAPFYALIAASVLLPLIAFALAAFQNRAHLEEAAEVEARRVARIFSEHALKVLETDEQVLRRIDSRLRGLSWDEVRASPDINAYLARVARETPHLSGAGLIGPDGRLAQMSEPQVPPIDLGDRDYVRQAPDGTAQSYVSAPVVGRISGRSLFRVTRRTDEGPGGGVIFVAMDPNYLVDFYRSAVRDGDSVTVARADGAVLVRDPPVTTGTGVLSPGSGLMRSIARSDSGVYRTVSELDRLERIHAYEKVGPYPIYVSYGLSLSGVAREWRVNLLAYGFVAVLSAVGLTVLSLIAMRGAAQERRTFKRFQEEARRREAAEAALRQAQKMEAVGQLTGGVAHDFNNLLTVIIGNLDMARRRMRQPDERVARAVDNALQGANRAAALVERLLVFSRRHPLAPRPVDLRALVGGMEDLLLRSLGENVALAVELAPDLWPVATDPNQLETALVNLAVNARDAMPAGGRLVIAAGPARPPAGERLSPGDYVAIRVSDTGEGMPPEVVERVFEPFFTTKPVGQGTGLGLSQVYGLARQSGGTVTIESRPGAGTAITLYLPRAREEAAPVDAAPAAEPDAGGGRECILVVEDQEEVRRFLVETLGEFGYGVLEAGEAEAGLALLERHRGVALLLTDIGLPGVSGVALAERAGRLRPDLPILLVTGHAGDERAPAGVGILRKPISAGDLARAVRSALDGPAAAAAE